MKEQDLIPGQLYLLKNGKVLQFSRISRIGFTGMAILHPPEEPGMQSSVYISPEGIERIVMTEKYYVIFGSEDGEPSIREMTKEQVLQIFNKDEYYEEIIPLPSLPKELDLCGNFDGNKVLIIKGEIVVPKPKQVVTEWEL